jgi:hypothetical protein
VLAGRSGLRTVLLAAHRLRACARKVRVSRSGRRCGRQHQRRAVEQTLGRDRGLGSHAAIAAAAHAAGAAGSSCPSCAPSATAIATAGAAGLPSSPAARAERRRRQAVRRPEAEETDSTPGAGASRTRRLPARASEAGLLVASREGSHQRTEPTPWDEAQARRARRRHRQPRPPLSRFTASAAVTAPSRRTTGSWPVRSTTVDGVPGSGP